MLKKCIICNSEVNFVVTGENEENEPVELYYCKCCGTLQELNLSENKVNVIEN